MAANVCVFLALTVIATDAILTAIMIVWRFREKRVSVKEREEG